MFKFCKNEFVISSTDYALSQSQSGALCIDNPFSLCPLFVFLPLSGGSCNGKCRSTARQTRPSLALAFLPDNHGMLITLRGGELVTGKQEKDYLRRFPEFRTFGARAGRPAGRGFSA